MVDPIGTKPVTTIGTRNILRTEAPARVAVQAGGSTVPPTTAASMAASAPLDMERVTMIRRAIEEGRFPLSPATIADRLIALKLDWTSNDKA